MVGGAAIYAFILIIIHFFFTGLQGYKIYSDSERGVRSSPIYTIVAVLSYVAIFVIILLIGGALFS